METDEIQAINRIEKETKIQIDLIRKDAENECKKIIEDAWKKVHIIEFAEREKLNNRLTELKMYRDKEEKPYFPKGGIKKITKSFIMLCIYAVMLNFFGFLISTPFATFAFIYDLKGENKIKPLPSAIIAIVVTAVLYLMFVYGFQVRLPSGKLF